MVMLWGSRRGTTPSKAVLSAVLECWLFADIVFPILLCLAQHND